MEQGTDKAQGMSPQQWERAGAFMDWRGYRIFYRDTPAQEQAIGGQPAATLVLVHGFPTSSWDWAEMWPALSRQYRVVAMDLLGFGFSDKPAAFDYRIEQQTDVVYDVLSHLGVREAIAVVHDYGVSVGQEMLYRQVHAADGLSCKVQGMLFLNGGLFPETHRPRFIQKLLASPMGWLVARLGNFRTFSQSFSAVFGAGTQPDEKTLNDFWQIITRHNGHHRFNRIIRYMQDRRRRRDDWLSALRDTTVPIRLVNGPDDPVSGAHMVARYRELLGDVDCVSLPGIGHYPQCEAPQAVSDAILQWVPSCLR